MIKIEDIYNEYLEKINSTHHERYKDHKGWFSASTAGTCFKKQHLKKIGAEEKPFDRRTLRVLRLGTVVHEDLEKAIKDYVYEDNIKVYTEKRIELPEVNVVGHLDIAFQDTQQDTLNVCDLKTAHSFKWKKMFGRNIDPTPSVNYQLQLGTYGIGLGRELDIPDVNLNIVWYKKDDSLMKVQPINNIWLDRAYEYWVELNEILEDNNVPEVGDLNTPVYNWECNYCPFKGTECKGI
jgi:hypothetical protein